MSILSIQHNNPGNLRAPGSRAGFQRFEDPVAGLESMKADLRVKVTGKSAAMKAKYGDGYQPTLRNILAVYAPSEENDTENYTRFVSEKAGINPDQPLSEQDVDKFVPAMVEMEGGKEAVKHFFGEQQAESNSAQEKPKLTKAQILAEIERRKSGAKTQKPAGNFSKDQLQAELDKRRNKPKNFAERVGEDFKKRENRVKEAKARYFAGKDPLIRPIAEIIGNTAGVGADVIGEGIVSLGRGVGGVLNTIYPDTTKELKQGVADLADDPIPKAMLKTAGAVMNSYGEFEKEHPTLGSLTRATANVGALAAPLMGGKAAPGGALTQMMDDAAKAAPVPVDNSMSKIVAKLRKDYPDQVEFENALKAYGQDGVSLAEVGGKHTTTLARGAAQFPSGEVATENFLKEQLSSLPGRIKKAASDYIHSDKNFYATVDDVLEKGRAKAAPLYDEAYKANKSIVSKEIDNILETPAGRKALKDTARVMQNDRALMGLPDKELKALQRDMAAIGKMDDVSGPIASGLNLRTLDAVKKNLDDQINKLYRAGDKYEGGVLNNLKNDLVKALDDADASGAYAKARAESGDYIRISKAIEEGRDFMKHDADLLKKHLEKLSPAEKDAFKIGVVRRVRDARINEILDVSDFKVSGRLENNKDMMGRLQAILPEKEFKAFQTAMKKEERLIKFRNKVLGGSPTTPKALAAAELDTAGRELVETLANQGVIATTRKSLVRLVSKSFNGVGDKTAGKIANVLYETDPAKKLEILRQIEQMPDGPKAVKKYFAITDKVREASNAIAAPAAVSANQ